MHLAHSHPLGGHLRAHNTLEKLRDHFHWPGMVAEVWCFCQRCPQYHRTALRVPAPALAPLIPLPIIGMPFKRVGMDIVGPLPKLARGHHHGSLSRVIIDYVTCYLEAVPLCKATSPNIAQELVLLFSQVSIPKYTDRPRHPIYVLADPGPMPAAAGATPPYLGVPPSN